MTTTPALTGRDIALAHNATRAVLETVLDDVGITFQQSIQLSAIADNGGRARRGDLAHRLADGLKISNEAAVRAVDSLIAAHLATPVADSPDSIEPTELGASTHRLIQEATMQIVATLYGGLPSEDLVVTQRTLATLTDRANRELANRS